MNELIVNEIVNGVTALFFGIAIIISAAWIAINIVRALKQRANTRTRAEIYNRLIDKFGTAPEFIAFLQSDAGLKFIEENAVQTGGALGKILAALQIGIILTLVGIGLLMLGNIFGSSRGGDLYIVLNITGTVGLMIGIGFLISSAISYRLSKTWGILTAKESSQVEKTNVQATENQ